VEYDEIIAAYFVSRPEGTPQPEVVLAAHPARRLRDACEPLAMHAVWSRLTSTRLAELGLDFFAAYVAGRAASLGEPDASVVASTFAWFAPGYIEGPYDAARRLVTRDRLIRVRDGATTESLRQVLGGTDPTETADLLADAVEPADGTGRALFCGLRARGRPADPVQRLWWACDLVREHRGDSHVAASLVRGLGPIEMSVLTELWLGMPLLSYTATRGWSIEAMEATVAALEARGWVGAGHLTAAGREVRDEVETLTDAQEVSIVDALGDRLEKVAAQLDEWSARCVAARAFPPDILKRAAG
jgi:hypothetical protein